jgi:glucuronate isomerase
MSFIQDDFLLQSKAAKELYHNHAAGQPIIDFHSHLPPEDVANDKKFENLYEIWLAGDHYKWRAMRAAGMPEELCTGDADPFDKYMAWAKTVPMTIRNPLYHWTHLELKRYFGIDELLSGATAKRIWDQANEQLASPEFSTRSILKRFKVEVACTTDDPAENLPHHEKISGEGVATKIYPTYRPDKAFATQDLEAFNIWLDKLAATAHKPINCLKDLLDALKKRHDDFHALGGRLSDHGLPHCFPPKGRPKSDLDALEAIFAKARLGEKLNGQQQEDFAAYILLYSAVLDAEKGWTKQLHLGPIRNNRSTLFNQAGPDAGGDSMNDERQVEPLARFLDALDSQGQLPKTIVYNMNPKDSMALATMIGNFQGPPTAGKLQYGSGWWYLDTKQGMQDQLNILSSTGLLSTFVGMLTDSRSFLSFTRHEYFRRILCNLIGQDIENGEIPDDQELTGNLIEGICYKNARNYFGFVIN